MDMARGIVMEVVEDAMAPGAIWTSGRRNVAGKCCLM